jgi:signal transduction histidine kinase
LLQQEITERKRIEIAEREQRTLAEALRDTAEALNSTLNLDEVLERILNNVGKVVQHDAANIMLIDSSLAKVQRHKGYVALQLKIADNYSLPVMEVSNLRWMYETGMPLVVPDTLNHPYYSNVPNTPLLRSYAGAPIVLDEAVIGFINLNSINPDFFNEMHIQRLQAFSDQAAVAIKNARLYEQAKHVAVIEERNRLARDLHDAVSQTLWSASLIADMLPRVWQQDPTKGEESLEELRQLSRNALSEMRALLIELRPGALVEKPLQELLYQLGETIKIRSGLNINLETDASDNLSPEVQVAFYRIAQEALNNIMRHGEARNVHVRFLTHPEWAELDISDDGKGFDTNNIPPGHMGISIMRERANAIGAKFDLKSALGNGTQINITWQKVDEDE